MLPVCGFAGILRKPDAAYFAQFRRPQPSATAIKLLHSIGIERTRILYGS
jgi:hypothetical protein